MGGTGDGGHGCGLILDREGDLVGHLRQGAGQQGKGEGLGIEAFVLRT